MYDFFLTMIYLTRFTEEEIFTLYCIIEQIVFGRKRSDMSYFKNFEKH